jgi:serine/threonine protein kinase
MVDFVKVLDFGLARYAEVEPSSAASRSVAFAGTPGYAAPEIIAGSSATPRSDVFSFGCLAYFLLQGRPPFGHATPAQALTAVLTQDPEPLDGSLPVELSRLLYECMSKSPEQRPSSLLLISERLKQIAQRCPAWTQADAEAWWRANPVSEGQETAHQSASLFIDIRRLRSTLPSDTSQLTGAVGRTREGARSGH